MKQPIEPLRSSTLDRLFPICAAASMMISSLVFEPSHAAEARSQVPSGDAGELIGTWTAFLESARIRMKIDELGRVAVATFSSAPLSDTTYEPLFRRGSVVHAVGNQPIGISIDLDSASKTEFSALGWIDADRFEWNQNGRDTFSRDPEGDPGWYLESWLTYAYLNPDPEQIIPAAISLKAAGLLRGDQPSMDLVGVFSQMLAQNPDRIDSWIERIDRSNEKAFWDNVLYYSGTDEAIAILISEGNPGDKRFARQIRKGPPAIDKIKPEAAWVLDLNWGSFMATGDTRYVRNCIRAFNLQKYEKDLLAWQSSDRSKRAGERVELGATFQVARWSVQSNCTQHRKVLDYCDTLLSTDDLRRTERAVLKEILDSVDIALARSHYSKTVRYKQTSPPSAETPKS